MENNGEYPKMYLYKRVVQAKLFIDDHYADKIDLDNIADEACFSKYHFIRLFKNIYGNTPHQYLTAVRIEKATLLLQEAMPVSEVCLAVGFETLSAFGGLFKRATGFSPSAFLEKQRQMRIEILQEPLKFIPACFIYQHGLDENSNFEIAG